MTIYLIFVNDIGECTSEHILSFADDTSLYLSDSDTKQLFYRANIEVNTLFNWFCANRLSLNPNKTKYIVIRSPSQTCHLAGLKLLINGTALSQIGIDFEEHSTKFLGVNIDEFLSWKYQLNYINTNISRSLFMIRQIKYILPPECLKTLYHTMIHPYITYGILVWGNATQQH